jgi:hypothetical protein
MNKETAWKELKNTLLVFLLWSITSLMDSIFIVLWVLVQYLASRIINNFNLSGIDRINLYIFQFLFALSSIAPVVLTVYRDITIMAVKTNRLIQHEIKPRRKK